jgi:hypothetical protein
MTTNAVAVQVHTDRNEYIWFDSNTPPQTKTKPKSWVKYLCLMRGIGLVRIYVIIFSVGQ